MAEFLQLLLDITNHPDCTEELSIFTVGGMHRIIESDPDLKRMVEGPKPKRIK